MRTSTIDRSAPEVGAWTVSPELDVVELWGQDSFPASDPPANW